MNVIITLILFAVEGICAVPRAARDGIRVGGALGITNMMTKWWKPEGHRPKREKIHKVSVNYMDWYNRYAK